MNQDIIEVGNFTLRKLKTRRDSELSAVVSIHSPKYGHNTLVLNNHRAVKEVFTPRTREKPLSPSQSSLTVETVFNTGDNREMTRNATPRLHQQVLDLTVLDEQNKSIRNSRTLTHDEIIESGAQTLTKPKVLKPFHFSN